MHWATGSVPADLESKFWFDPLYIEDPLRPSNNVGRNCFRIYAIQQEFQKAHQLCSMAPSESECEGACEYPVLGRIAKKIMRP